MVLHADPNRWQDTSVSKNPREKKGGDKNVTAVVGADHPIIQHFRATYPVTDETLQKLRGVTDNNRSLGTNAISQHMPDVPFTIAETETLGSILAKKKPSKKVLSELIEADSKKPSNEDWEEL